MIDIAATAQRSFAFPAHVDTALIYYSDFQSIAEYLPHVELVKAYSAHQFRMRYHSTELGVYQVKIYCDIAVQVDNATRALIVPPVGTYPPVKTQATLNSLTAQGEFRSQSVFYPEGQQTRVEYALELHATLPKPFGLNFMPTEVLQRIAHNITNWRVHEIADGFVTRSMEAFREI